MSPFSHVDCFGSPKPAAKSTRLSIEFFLLDCGLSDGKWNQLLKFIKDEKIAFQVSIQFLKKNYFDFLQTFKSVCNNRFSR